MSDITQIIANARAYLQDSQSEQALEILTPLRESQIDNVAFLQIFGETLLENNNVEGAYEVLMKSCDLDPNASQGCENFFYLGQIIGGFEGLKYLDTGLKKLEYQLRIINENNEEEIAKDENLLELGEVHDTKEQIVKYLIKKLNQGLFAKIEIWMTDLCMEEEAEQQCDNIITYSLKVDEENPEAWSLLASIRISQQRNDEAITALKKSWELFSVKKTRLEEFVNKQIEAQQEQEEIDEFEVNIEYVELIQPLLTLARFALELGLFELSILISSSIQDINEDVLESYYLEGFANYVHAKKLQWLNDNKGLEDFNDLELNLNIEDGHESKSYITDARNSLTSGFKLLQNDEEVDPELSEQINVLLNELGGPDLKREKLDLNGDDWEDEIQSEDEAME